MFKLNIENREIRIRNENKLLIDRSVNQLKRIISEDHFRKCYYAKYLLFLVNLGGMLVYQHIAFYMFRFLVLLLLFSSPMNP